MGEPLHLAVCLFMVLLITNSACFGKALEPLPIDIAKAAMTFESADFSPDASTLALVMRRTLPDLDWPKYRTNVPLQPTMWMFHGSEQEVFPGMFCPRWSPDGHRLAALAVNQHKTMALMCREGSGPFQVIVEMPFQDNGIDYGWLSDHELVATIRSAPSKGLLRRDSGPVSLPSRTTVRLFDLLKSKSRDLFEGSLWSISVRPSCALVAAVVDVRLVPPERPARFSSIERRLVVSAPKGLHTLDIPHLQSVAPSISRDGRFVAVQAGAVVDWKTGIVRNANTRLIEIGPAGLHLVDEVFDAVTFTSQGVAVGKGDHWSAYPSGQPLPSRPIEISGRIVYITPQGLVGSKGDMILAGKVSVGSTMGSYLHDGHEGTFIQGDRTFVLDNVGALHTVPGGARVLAIRSDGTVCRWEREQEVRLGDEAKPLLRVNAFLDSYEWGEVRTIKRDTLLLPPGHKNGKLPAIIYLYPNVDNCYNASRGAGSSLQVSLQPLARAGYAVFLPYLEIPTESDPAPPAPAIRAAFRSAVKRAIATGFVDAKRIGIFGQSYGGYSVLVTSLEPGIRAGVAISPVADLGSFYARTDKITTSPDSFLRSTFGFAWAEEGQGRMHVSPWEDPSRYVENSPFYQAGNVQTPLLLVGTTEDEEGCRQAGMFFAALYRAGRESRLLVYPQEEHGIFRAPDLCDFWQQVVSWFNDHMR